MPNNLIEFENEFTWGKAISDNTTDQFHENFEKGIDEAKKEIGNTYPIIINGIELYSDETFTVKSPSDTRIIIGKFSKATISDTHNAISSAKNAFERLCRQFFPKEILFGCNYDI